MHCVHCGSQLPEGAKFCTSCGRAVAPVIQSPEQEPDTVSQFVDGEHSDEASSQQHTSSDNFSDAYKAANNQLPNSYSNPNYSSQVKSSSASSASQTSNVLAIVGFVCSLILIPVGIGSLCAVAGLVLSIMGLSSSRKLPENKGHGLAVAGVVISAVRIVIIFIALIALIGLMFRGAGHVGHELISNWSEYMPYSF